MSTRISRLLFLARSMSDPTTESVAADNIPLVPACDRNGILYTRAVGGAGGIVANPTPGWVATSDPAANTQASCSFTGENTLIVNTITATLSNNNVAATGILKVYLRNNIGGTILWSANIQAGPNTGQPTATISVGGLNITVPSGTAQLQFSAAGGALTQENVSMSGYDIPE